MSTSPFEALGLDRRRSASEIQDDKRRMGLGNDLKNISDRLGEVEQGHADTLNYLGFEDLAPINDNIRPAAPQNLVVTPVPFRELDAIWDAPPGSDYVVKSVMEVTPAGGSAVEVESTSGYAFATSLVGGTEYSVRVKLVDRWDLESDWSETVSATPLRTAAEEIDLTALSILGRLNGLLPNANLATIVDATKLGAKIVAEAHIADGAVRALQIADAALTTAKFASGIRPVEIGAVLPTLPSAAFPQGAVFLLTTDNKMYRSTGPTWTSATSATDMTGQVTAAQIAIGAITADKLAAGAVDLVNFASGIRPVQLGSVLPTLPSATYPQGAHFFLTTDNKTYRSTGSSWTTAVPTVDLSGTLASIQIADGAILSAKLADNAVVLAKLAANAVDTSKLVDNAITTIKIATGAIDASKIADAQITLAKFASGIRPVQVGTPLPTLPSATYPQGATFFLTTDNKLYRSTGSTWTTGVASVDLSGTIAAAQIADGAVLTAKLADNSVALAKMQANSVDASQILANAITTVKIASSAVDATKIAVGAIDLTKFASGLRPVQTGTVLPTLPDANYPATAVFSLNAGGTTKLYRSTGTTWTSAIPTVDLTGQIVGGQIGIGEVTSEHLTIGSVPDNVIPNSSFEEAKAADATKPARWSAPYAPYSSGSGAFSTAEMQSGSQSYALTATSTQTYAVASDPLPVIAGDRWYVSVRHKASVASSGDGFYVRATFGTTQTFTGEGTLITVASNIASTSTWQKTGGQFTVPAGVTYMRLELLLHTPNNDCTVYLDDAVGRKATISEVIADAAIDLTKFASGLRPLQVVGTLPTLPSTTYPQGATVFLTTDNKLYRSTGSAWTATVPTVDLSGTIASAQIADGAILTTKLADGSVLSAKLADGAVALAKLAADSVDTSKLVDNAITTVKIATGAIDSTKIADAQITLAKFAAGLRPVQVVGTLPTLPSATYPQGAAVVLTTDNKLYRSTGTTWTAGVPTVDLSGTIASAQIADGAIGSVKLADGSVLSAKLATGAVLLDKLAADSVDTSKLVDSAITTVKIAIGAIDSTKIADAQITLAKFAAGLRPVQVVAALPSLPSATYPQGATVFLSTDNKLYRSTGTVWESSVGAADLSGQITETQITDSAISTAKLAANAVTAVKILAGTITSAQIAADTITAGQIAAGAINTSELAAGAVNASKIAAGAITANEIAANTITAGQIASNAITATELAALSVVAGKIAANAISATEIQAGAITTAKIVAGAITATELATDSVVAIKIQAGAISTTKIAANAVTANEILASTITSAQIAADTITAGQIAAGAINTSELAAGAVNASKIAANTITANEVAANTITSGQIAANAITATELAALSVVAGKIAANAISATEIQAGAITTAKLVAGAITATELATDSVVAIKIQAGAITTAKLAANAVTANEIAALTITAAQIAANAITSTQLAANSVIAGKIAAGVVTAAEIAAGAITTEKLTVGGLTDSLLANGGFEDVASADATLPANWRRIAGTSATVLRTTTAANVHAGSAALEISPGAGLSGSSVADTVPVNESEVWYVSFWARSSGTNAGTSPGFFIQLRGGATFNASTQVVACTGAAGSPAASNSIVPSTWTKYEATVTIPAAMLWGAPFFTLTGGNTGATIHVDDVEWKKVIVSAVIGAGAITTAKIFAGAVTANEIGALAVTAAKIAGATITATQIATSTITSTQMAANSITSNQLATNSVVAGKIAAGVISATEIASGAITTIKISAGAVTATELFAGAVTTAKIAAAAVTATEIAAGAVTTEKLTVGGLTDSLLANGSVEDVAVADATLPANWRRGAAGFGGTSTTAFRTTTAANVHSGGAAIELSPGAGVSASLTADTVPVNEGDTWYLALWARSSGTNAGTSPGFYIRLLGGATFNATTQVILTAAPGSRATENNAVPTAWTKYEAQITIPAGMKFAGPLVFNYTSNTGATIHVDDVTFRKVVVSAVISDGAITTAKLVAGAITTNELGALSVTAAKIAVGTITANELAAGSIITAKISAGAVTATQIAANTITATQIAANTITANELVADTITAGQIAAGAISTSELAANAVTAAKIAVGTITANELAALSVTTVKIVAGAVTANEIAALSITTAKIVAGAITTNELGANAVTAAKIAVGTITANELAAGSVTTLKLAALAVTANEIAANTITANKIAADTITANEMAANSITSSELAANSVIAGKIAAAAISATEIAAGSITTEKLTIGRFADSVLANAGFEDAAEADATLPANWRRSLGTSTTAFRTTTAANVHSGAASIQLSPGAGVSAQLISDTVPVNEGEVWYVSCWARSSGTNAGTSPGFYVQLKGGATFNAATSSVAITADAGSRTLTNDAVPTTWTQYQGTIAIPAGVKWAAPAVLNNTTNTGATFHVDDVQFKKIIVSAVIGSGSISTAKLQANAVTAAKILAGTITADEIAAETITGDKIAVNTITAGQIATGAIHADEIAAREITANKIALNTITADEIAANTIEATNIKANTITGDRIAARTILGDSIAVQNLAAVNGWLANAAIVSAKIESLTADKIATGTLAAGTITLASSGKILAGATTFDAGGVELPLESTFAQPSQNTDYKITGTGDFAALSVFSDSVASVRGPALRSDGVSGGIKSVVALHATRDGTLSPTDAGWLEVHSGGGTGAATGGYAFIRPRLIVDGDIVLPSPDGTLWQIEVDNTGALVTTDLSGGGGTPQQMVFTIAANADDQITQSSGGTYPPTGAGFPNNQDLAAFTFAEREVAGGSYQVRLALLKWNTSALPDNATIDSAILRLNVNQVLNADSRSLTADWFTWTGVGSNDYTATAGTNAHAGSALSGISTGDRDFILINANTTNINRTGTTYVRLHISGGQPTGTNRVVFAGRNDSSTLCARLIVNYTV